MLLKKRMQARKLACNPFPLAPAGKSLREGAIELMGDCRIRRVADRPAEAIRICNITETFRISATREKRQFAERPPDERLNHKSFVALINREQRLKSVSLAINQAVFRQKMNVPQRGRQGIHERRPSPCVFLR